LGGGGGAGSRLGRIGSGGRGGKGWEGGRERSWVWVWVCDRCTNSIGGVRMAEWE